jgi:hypothetical protein
MRALHWTFFAVNANATCTSGDCQNGKGLWTWDDGAMYDGEWKDHRMDGMGMSTYADGTTYDGEWEGAKKVGKV